jgi:hypothetical protein
MSEMEESSAISLAPFDVLVEEGFGCVQKSHNCRPGSVAHADYPAKVFSAKFEAFGLKKNFQ